jgi:hypothetical protein
MRLAMPIAFACSCGANLRVPGSAAGKTIACPKCKEHIKVPFHEEGAESNFQFKSKGISQFQMPGGQEEYDRDSDEALGHVRKVSSSSRASAKSNTVAWLLGVCALVLICCAGSVAFFMLGVKEQHQQKVAKTSLQPDKITQDSAKKKAAEGQANDAKEGALSKDLPQLIVGKMKIGESYKTDGGNQDNNAVHIMGNTWGKILQIVDNDNMLIGIDNGEEYSGGPRFATIVWCKFSTKGLTDGKKGFFAELISTDEVRVSGTTRYKTTSGGTRTVFVLEPRKKK